MEIQFVGAARTITGSTHRVKANRKQFLFDSGTYEGSRGEAIKRNKLVDFFDPAEIDFVILSDAHLDYCGNLPSSGGGKCLAPGDNRPHLQGSKDSKNLQRAVAASPPGLQPHEPQVRLRDSSSSLSLGGAFFHVLRHWLNSYWRGSLLEIAEVALAFLLGISYLLAEFVRALAIYGAHLR